MRNFTAISTFGNWSFWIQEYFYTAYNPELARQTSVDEKTVLLEYRTVREFYLRQFGKEGIFVDVGANVGLSSLGLAVSGVQCECFEPVAENAQLIVKSACDNNVASRVRVHHCALSNENGTATIFVPERSDNSSLSSSVAVYHMPTKRCGLETIPTIRFDDTDIDKSQIHMVKIDVQGFEPEVVEGMSDFLVSCKPGTAAVIELEDNLLAVRGKSPSEVIDAMSRYYFRSQRWYGNDFLFIKG